jgi:hypothetical protein
LHLIPLLVALLLLASAVGSPASAQEEVNIPLLQQAALDKDLARQRTWEVLLHYTRPMTGGIKSRIDDPNFFFAPDGRTNPKAELLANLQQLTIAPEKDGTYYACRFPARYQWLIGELGIDPARLPAYSCAERDRSLGAVDAQSAVLVFPVGHINSPASMFGHTLIRIDGSSKSNLISYAGNYAAITTDTNGFVYAWKGIFGGYKGYYSLMPYYIKVKEYNDLEHRDMWEYRLKLSTPEVRKMLNHIWELQAIKSSYYFLDENCSYNLLFLIEAGRPELHLTDRTGLFVLPTQTIEIAKESGILEEPRYRPSQGTRIRSIVAQLPGEARQLSWDLAYGVRQPAGVVQQELPREENIGVLDAAIEFLQFRYARKELAQDDFNKSYLKLLAQRSSLGAAPAGLFPIAEPPRPESGHSSSKFALGGGVRRSEGYLELETQLALHGLLDPDQGFLRGSQIRFLDTVLDYRLPDHGFRLRTLQLLDILSLTPRDTFFKPLSWKVNTGLATEPLRNGQDDLLYRLNTGGGFAFNTALGGLWYLMGELDLNLADKLRGTATVGPGLSAGVLEQLTDWWKVHVAGSAFWYKVGDDRVRINVSADQNFRLGQNSSLSLLIGLTLVNGHRVPDNRLLWNYYF